MSEIDWASALDRLFEDPQNQKIRSWAEGEIARGACTPGQHRAYGLLTTGESVVELLQTTPGAVRKMVESVPADRLLVAPGDGEWNAVQIVHHLADNEAVNAVRIRSVLTEDTPEIFGYDSDPWTRFFSVEPVEDALERFEVSRRNTVALVRSLSSEDLDRKGVLSYRGAESLRVLLAVLAGHDRDHLDQLRDTLAAGA
ncbi:DinB family protein [Streptomyces sp. NRRL F-5755]|uniref:DinB family protein n=1 Tax=Streptomyces sp. NRRL F-5755 TaxID=1519475 RepID=UPI00099B59E7|nr:DinB family protein [Streptomyces sp. NRRL F-5755]